MLRAAALIRSYAVVVLGAAALVVGIVLLSQPATPSFGWTAYAPLSHTTYAPSLVNGTSVLGAVLAAVGLVLVAGWVGFIVGRRTRVRQA
jgi:heme/copper-type cytochrome/quinol oxidase subunit 1